MEKEKSTKHRNYNNKANGKDLPFLDISKVMNNINKYIEKSEVSTAKFVVLYLSGGLCPVHLMHVGMFEIAKKFIEQKGLIVVGGWLGPSSQGYIQSKLPKHKQLSAENRVELCRLATNDSDWLSYCDWDVNHGYTSSSRILSLIELYIQKHSKLQFLDIECWWLCGADHALRCNLYHKRPTATQIIAVGRKDHTEQLTTELKEAKSYDTEIGNNFYITETETEPISSTIVRERLERGQSLDGLLHPAVTAYIIKNNLLNSKSV